MSKQLEQNTDRYNDVFPTTLRTLLESHPRDGHSTTYKALGEACGVRQQTISQYASGQTNPTADVLLKIAKFFDVSMDYLMTGTSSYNKEYTQDLGLSDAAIEKLRRARELYSDNAAEDVQTIPYLDALLSDGDFYQFLEELKDSTDRLLGLQNGKNTKKYPGLDVERYYIWSLQMSVQEFILEEIKKLGLKIESK